jgi:AcrR family transcriptional regulator
MSSKADVMNPQRTGGSVTDAAESTDTAESTEDELLDGCLGDDPSSDHRRAPRRRGDALTAAIFEATMHELQEVGYSELTMERVASRARASKGSLYRRWSSRAALVVDAMDHAKTREARAPDTGSVREDLLGYLLALAEGMNGAAGEAGRGLMAECVRDPELMEAVRLRFTDRAVAAVLDVLRRGAVRGEVRASALTHRIASIGPALLRHQFMVYGAPIPEAVVTEIVDDVLVPLISA